jgi:cell division protein FtsB
VEPAGVISSRTAGRPVRAGGGPDAPPDGGRRRLVLTVVAMVAISLSLGALFGKRGLLDRLRYAREHARLTVEIGQLEREVAALEEEIRALDGDPVAVERIAREELSLGRPGEVVVFLGPGPLERPVAPPAKGVPRPAESDRRAGRSAP